MCGRFAMDKSTDDLIEEFVAVGGDFRDWRPGWNIRPTDPVAVVLESMKDGPEPTRRLEVARWSLTPRSRRRSGRNAPSSRLRGTTSGRPIRSRRRRPRST
jgi:putative SOS response-associated peptidase YedK